MKLPFHFHRPGVNNSLFRFPVIFIICASLSSCASIVSKTNWPVSIDSKPEGVHVSITNKRGIEVFSGKTPVLTKLKSGSGYFSKESYTVVMTYKGNEKRTINLECSVNGWYFGNLLIGGLIGMLIVDPATGAMFKLDRNEVYEVFKENSTSQLKIFDINNIPLEWKTNLVEL
jgi:hypothetical protein